MNILKNIYTLSLLILGSILLSSCQKQDTKIAPAALKLWYNQPAQATVAVDLMF